MKTKTDPTQTHIFLSLTNSLGQIAKGIPELYFFHLKIIFSFPLNTKERRKKLKRRTEQIFHFNKLTKIRRGGVHTPVFHLLTIFSAFFRPLAKSFLPWKIM